MKWLKVIRALLLNLIVLTLVYLFNHKLSDITFISKQLPAEVASLPPVGKFIDPFQGFWANAEPKEPAQQLSLTLPDLQEEVEIIFDDRLVPHIFAQNQQDMFFTQGYITAKYRLWQMEFQTHAAGGRLCEIIGDRALPYDVFQRRIGMVYGAEQSVKAMMEDSTTRAVVLAYTAGINAYIDQLSFADYPIEYKILDYAPEAWTPLKTALLLKYMAFDLSAQGSNDVKSTMLLARYGKAITDSLLPRYFDRISPVIPSGTNFDFRAEDVAPLPEAYDSITQQMAQSLEKQQTAARAEKAKGSNNWAVSGRKSATGYPILANDPHLSLSFPSIWYEIQLSCPGYQSYGVSLPGAPAIIIGFNKDISWGVTNAYNDVLDFYQMKFKDEAMTAYYHDGQWKETTRRKDTIRIRGGKEVIEEITFTHHGPIVLENSQPTFGLDVPPKHAMRWLALEPSNELKTFHKLNRARNYEEFVEALSQYACPAQNFAYADNENIALWVNGKMPKRWKEQGKYILDGTDAAHDWQGWIPHQQLPHVKNPRRGFISSANQPSTDTTLYPYYIGWDYSSPERGIRINERLTEMGKITVDDLQDLQNDNTNVRARTVLPILLQYLNASQLRGNYKQAYNTFLKWRYLNNANMISPTVFDVWWDNLVVAIWKDDVPTGAMFPEANKTVQLLMKDTASRWFDDKKTINEETIKDIVNQSYQKSIDQLTKELGNFGEAWQWGKYNPSSIIHLTRAIPSFSVEGLETGGGPIEVNANNGNNGPSWRMIVAMGETVQGYGIYPGGQSGNPGSFYYDNMVERWRIGELAELLFFEKADERNPKIISRLTLAPK